MNFSGKEGHPNIQPSTRPGIEPGTLGLGDRDFNHCAKSSNPLPCSRSQSCSSSSPAFTQSALIDSALGGTPIHKFF